MFLGMYFSEAAHLPEPALLKISSAAIDTLPPPVL